MKTEDDTFNALRRTPLNDSFLEVVDPEVEMSMQAFMDSMDRGLYDLVLQKHGWTRDSFYDAYCVKYVMGVGR